MQAGGERDTIFLMAKNTPRDYINIIIADMHSGSDRAMFPPRIVLPPLMADEHKRTLHGTPQQVAIYDHVMQSADIIKKKYANYVKVVTFNGDMTEGVHHYTIQLSAPMLDDHVIIHKELAEEFLNRIGFSLKNGDELHYVSGTEAHTNYVESRIASEFEVYNAQFHDEAKLLQNGKNIWLVHQWVGVGKGVSEGAGIVNGLKTMYYDSKKEGWDMPDLVIGSHYHKSALGSFSQDFKTYYGIVTPALQRKTRFGQKVSPFQRNDIGIQLVEVTSGGLLNITPPMLLHESAL